MFGYIFLLKQSLDESVSQEEDSKSFWNLFPDRFKNGLYGYIITSFLLFNWENILLILKSKNDIEMTLIYISTQQNFTFNFFWMPLISGIIAAFTMPLISTGYSLYTGGMTAMRNDSLGFGGLLWKNIKANLELRQSGTHEIINKLNQEVADLSEMAEVLNDKVNTYLAHKNNLESFLEKIVGVYQTYPLINTDKEFLEILKALRHKGIFECYPGGSDIRAIKSFLNEAESVLSPTESPSTSKQNLQRKDSNSKES